MSKHPQQFAPPEPARAYFLDEVCGFLRVSRSTVERLRRYGAFPIPELPSLDKRPRFSGADILRYLEGQTRQASSGHRFRSVR